MNSCEPYNLCIMRGDTQSFNFTFSENEALLDITGATVHFTVKTSRDDIDAEAVIQKVVTSHTDPTNGETTVDLTPTDTAIDDGLYAYDVQITTSDARVFTVLSGTVSVGNDVTKS